MKSLSIFIAINDSDFTPQSVFSCIGLGGVEKSQDGYWRADVTTEDPDEIVHLFAHKCDNHDEHTHHFNALLINGYDREGYEPVAETSWEKIASCMSSIDNAEGPAVVEGVFEYNSSEFKSILSIQDNRLIGMAGQPGVSITGVELDFKEADGPLSRAVITDRGEIWYLHIFMNPIDINADNIGRSLVNQMDSAASIFALPVLSQQGGASVSD